MKILLTGATGFIGGHLLSHCPEIQFRPVKRLNSQIQHQDPFFINELNGKTSWHGAFKDIDVIIHLAGLAHKKELDEQKYYEVNIQGTLHLAQEAARAGVKRFVFVSSIHVNGTMTTGTAFDEQQTPMPADSYAKSKFQAEQGLVQLADETGMEIVVIRPPLVYGAMASANFGKLVQLVMHSPVTPFGLSSNKRSLISVTNLSDFILTCTRHPAAAGHLFTIGEGEPVSTRELMDAIALGLNRSLTHVPVPNSLMSFAGKILGKEEMVQSLLSDLEVDFSKAEELLGWSPVETMEQAMGNLKKRYHV